MWQRLQEADRKYAKSLNCISEFNCKYWVNLNIGYLYQTDWGCFPIYPRIFMAQILAKHPE